MDTLDGVLMVPPDRGQILGRAVWKSRYVTISRRTVPLPRDEATSPSYNQPINTGRGNYVTYMPPDKPTSSPTKALTEDYFICMYKSKEDLDPVQHWPLSHVTDCQVQNIAHPRKQGPVLPTLTLTISDKERKRRSSRAAGFMSKDLAATTVVFRTPPDDHHLSLHHWARFIMSRKTPMSPGTPTSPVFSNPFQPQSAEALDYVSRPTSGNPNTRADVRALQHKSSSATYSTSTRERPMTFSSASPSLKSKRSDVSSPSSNLVPAHQVNYQIHGQHYTTVLPTDLPSPITSVDDYQGDFIEGWTAAQGRASTISTPTHGRDSISSQPRKASAAATDSSSPPRQRETILDRAFLLRCIPGMENEVPGEEKLSSLARFDALMREADEKRRHREAVQRAGQTTMRSAFEADDSSEDEAETENSDDTDSNYDDYADERQLRSPPPISNSALQALDYISGRPEPDRTPTSARPMSKDPRGFPNGQAVSTLTQYPPMRPHTAHAKSRPSLSHRVLSTSQLPFAASSQDLPSVAEKPSETSNLRPNGDQRYSGSSAKRLSFSEFTKRISSTSSLLLVQTNASGGSSRGSYDSIQPAATPRPTSMMPRGAGPPPLLGRDSDQDDKEKKCTWRNSVGVGVGVIGADGGFF